MGSPIRTPRLVFLTDNNRMVCLNKVICLVRVGVTCANRLSEALLSLPPHIVCQDFGLYVLLSCYMLLFGCVLFLQICVGK